MPIGTDRNSTYGGTEVTNKYSPLRTIVFHKSDNTIYDTLTLNRWRLLNSTGLLPQPLNLTVANWTATIGNEAGKRPPLVVISSNRSEWIKTGISAARTQRAYDNASDFRALTFDNSFGVSPPIYSPTRIGDAGPRNVYIVVHQFEYETYQKNLAGLDVNVVGWSFRTPRSGAARITGFGASRFAAIEFCKELRRAATPVGAAAPWNYAWLLDDNVVALSKFAGYRAVETAMGAGAGYACAGFKGCTTVDTFASNQFWAADETKKGRGRQAAALPASEAAGILQQAVLWNIEYLTSEKLNFGPAYVMSGEDVSLSNYFNKEETPYLYYKTIEVRKEDTRADNSPGSQSVRRAREEFIAWFAEMESSEPTAATPPPPPPPPVIVQGSRDGERDVVSLTDYIVKRVLPGCGMKPADRTVAVQNTAKCQAIEQIMCGAINSTAPGVLVDPDALEKTFKFNGPGPTAAQTIVRVDKPARP